MKKEILVLLSIFLIGNILLAQDELLNLLEVESTTPFVTATFKDTKIINLQSNESPAANQLQFIISHRFGTLSEGAYELWGLDQSVVRFHLSYGITNSLSAGWGRTSDGKIYDGWLKYKLVRQGKSPISITGYNGIFIMTHKTRRWQMENSNASSPSDWAENPFSDKVSYAHQVIIARKFSKKTSLAIVPTMLHFNLVDSENHNNDLYAISIGGRQKITSSISFNAEYNYVITSRSSNNPYTNSLSIGFDIETGGHVFQLHFTNSKGMVEPAFIGETVGKWGNGDIWFGFNISRQFNLNKN